MSYWQSYILSNYITLSQIFGEPGKGSSDGKVRHIWHLELPDGTKYSIYDWKENKFSKNTIIEWHIGTDTPEDSDKVIEYLDNNTELNTYTNRYPMF